jgi:hypothetical protein
VAKDGGYIPPKNVEITNDGKILVATKDSNGNILVKEVPKIVTAVFSPGTITVGSSTTTTTTTSTTTNTNTLSDSPLLGTGTVDSRFAPTGGFTGVNDPTRVTSPYADTTIRVSPAP